MWPNSEAVAKRGGNLFADFKQGLDIHKYATTGQEDKRAAGSKPTKTGVTTVASKGGNWKSSSLAVPQDSEQHQTISSEVGKSTKPQPDVMCGSHLKSP